MGRLDGKICVITGAGGGMGREAALLFSEERFRVIGFDIDPDKVGTLNAGKSYIPDVSEADLAACVKAGTLRATTDMSQLGTMDAIGHVKTDAAIVTEPTSNRICLAHKGNARADAR